MMLSHVYNQELLFTPIVMGKNSMHIHHGSASFLFCLVFVILKTDKTTLCLLLWNHRGPITRFFEKFRPKITVPYVFITSRTDGTTPFKTFTQKLDDDPLLLKWYGINPSYQDGANHSKFRPYHLGITGSGNLQQEDFSFLMKARGYLNPFGGDKSLWTESIHWKTAVDTTPFLFVKFGLNGHTPHRLKPFQMACENRTMAPLDDVSCNMTKKAKHIETYTAASKYLFGLSPPGKF